MSTTDPPPAPAPLPDLPDSGPPPLSGPEIPGADVSPEGVFRVRVGDSERYESARMTCCLAPLFDEEMPIDWLWPGRIPLGLVTVIEGAAGVGKSPLVADLVARVTRGAPWPGRVEGPQLAGDVLVVSGELGGWERVIFPRLKLAGADLPRIAQLIDIDTCEPLVEERGKSHSQRPLAFPGDLGHLEYCLRMRPQTRLVVIDPLAAYCPDARAWRETLRKLHEIAARRNVAIVVVTGRPGRASGRSRFQMSADPRSDEVRILFNVLEDAEEEGRERRFFAPARMSFCAAPEWLAFQIVGGRVEWEPPLAAPPEEALPPRPGEARGKVIREVKDWLRDLLDKDDVPIKATMAEAQLLGYSKMTVRRAREALEVRMFRQGGGRDSVCWWTMRQEPDAVGLREDKEARRGGDKEKIGTADEKSVRLPSDAPARRAPDVSPGAAPNVEPAPTRRSRPRVGARRKAPREPALAGSRGDWQHLRDAVLEELNIAEVLNGDTASVDAAFEVPPSGSNGKHSSNGKPDSNRDHGFNGKRRKPR